MSYCDVDGIYHIIPISRAQFSFVLNKYRDNSEGVTKSRAWRSRGRVHLKLKICSLFTHCLVLLSRVPLICVFVFSPVEH